MKFRDRLARWMYGRYGNDHLNRLFLALAILFLIVSIFAQYQVFYWIAVLFLVLAYFRMFSKNIYKRSAENTKYLNMTAGIRRFFSRGKARSQDKTHRYFKCPGCGQTVRVPRGRGKIQITCPKCRREFIKKT